MPRIGFSTGALAKGDFRTAVGIARGFRLDAIELSALRLCELAPLVEFAMGADLSDFHYISVHAPTDYVEADEERVVECLESTSRAGWPVIVHPDRICSFPLWNRLGEIVLIENMDKRKQVGRTVEELDAIFDLLPRAGMCFDIAHARQVDSSMTEAYRILRRHGPRVRQLHVSEVNSTSKHDRISDAALRSFREVSDAIPYDIPVILETPVTASEALEQLERASRILVPQESRAAPRSA